MQHQGEVHQVPPGLTIHNRILYIFVNYQSDDLSKGGIISRVALSVLWAWKLKTWNTSFPAFSNIFALAQQTPSFKKLEYFPSPNNPPLLILKLFLPFPIHAFTALLFNFSNLLSYREFKIIVWRQFWSFVLVFSFSLPVVSYHMVLFTAAPPFFVFCPYLGAVTALLPPPRLSRAVPTTGQVSGHQTTITTTGTRWPWWWRSPPLALTPPLTGGTTTQCVSGGTITVQEVAVVFCNYQHHHQHFHSKAVQSNKHLQVLSTTRWSHSGIELQIYRHKSEILYFLL